MNDRGGRRAVGATAPALAAVAPLAGCAADPETPRSATPTSTLGGPWAAEFADALSGASPYERRALSDGVITAAERAEAQHRMKTCMRDAGYAHRDFDDGTGETERTDGADLDLDDITETTYRCSHRWSHNISYLYNEVRRNPQHLDEAEISAACLRASGLVGKDYTDRRWRDDNDSGDWPYDDHDPRAVQCRLDPLGLWRDQ